MARTSLHYRLIDDGARVLIELTVDDRALGHIIYEADELSKFIVDLGLLRAKMTEKVTRELEPNALMPMVDDPLWVGDTPTDRKALALRHPGLGWILHLFPPHEAEKISRHLRGDPTDQG